jgi:hypothetical protein
VGQKKLDAAIGTFQAASGRPPIAVEWKVRMPTDKIECLFFDLA